MKLQDIKISYTDDRPVGKALSSLQFAILVLHRLQSHVGGYKSGKEHNPSSTTRAFGLVV